MSSHIEVEAKFLSPRRIAVASIESFLKSLGLKAEWQEPQKQRDIYWDTPERKLIEEGVVLRVRCAAGKFIATFKGSRAADRAVFARPEVEWDLTAQEAATFQQCDNWVPMLPTEVASYFSVDPARLERVLTVDTLRRRAIISDTQGFRAELALDAITFMKGDSQAKHGEIELELKAGSSAQLENIAEALQRRFLLEPSRSSKFEVGMTMVGVVRTEQSGGQNG